MTRLWVQGARGLAFGLLLTSLFGCAGSGGETSPSADPAFTELLDQTEGFARSEGASDEQIALLERARSEGVVSYETEHEALVNFFSCLDDKGIGYKDLTVTAGRVFPRVDYQVFSSDPTAMDLCYAEHAASVDSLYQLQPAVIDEVESLVEQHSAGIIACLREAGYEISNDPTYDELRSAAYFAWNGTYPDDPAAQEPAGFVPVDCYGAVGLVEQDYHAGQG